MKTGLWLAALCLSWLTCAAQQVAVKDLTTESAPVREDDLKKRCFSPGYRVADGVALGGRGILQFEIVAVEPKVIVEGSQAVVTVRVKNVGKEPTEIPWSQDYVAIREDRAKSERAHAELTVRIPYASGAGLIKGGAALYAVPGDDKQHFSLEPGQWVEIRFKVVARCQANPRCATSADARVLVVAEWMQWTYFENRDPNDCVSETGSYFVSEKITKPYEVSVVPGEGK